MNKPKVLTMRILCTFMYKSGYSFVFSVSGCQPRIDRAAMLENTVTLTDVTRHANKAKYRESLHRQPSTK